jgi:MYXO-CTERM domain-containing protein
MAELRERPYRRQGRADHPQGHAAAIGRAHHHRHHTAEDTLALTNGKADHSLYFARYGVAYMAELAKGSLPPVTECDATRACAGNATCQNGTCVANADGSAGAAGMVNAGGVGGAGGAGGAPGGDQKAAGAGGSASGGAVAAGGTAPTIGGMPTLQPNSSSPGTATDSANGCACRAVNAPATPQQLLWLLLPVAGLFVRRRATLAAT